jgi:frataxin-like iron-binding protein CyaY
MNSHSVVIKRIRFGCFILVLFAIALAEAVMAAARIRGTNRRYQQGDWITYSSTRFVRQIAIGQELIYFATTGGITRYNFFSNKWEFPWTVSNGLANDNIRLVAPDFNTGYLWCVNDLSISYLEPASQLWYNTFFDEIGLNDRETISSIGFGSDRRVYIVTSQNRWLASDNVTATFNHIDAIDDGSSITWYGAKARAEASLPYLFMSGGYLFDERSHYIDDLHFRHFDITCWVRDRWQNLWLGTWGLGAGKAYLPTSRLEMLKFGLWDQSVETIGKDGDALWLGGIQDEASHAGVTEWFVPDGEPNYYEAYLLTGFSNDQVTSIEADGNTLWLGTRDGLTRYDRKKGIWRTYTVVNHLTDNRINDIAIDDHSVWVATDGGVSEVDKATVGTDSMRIHSVLYPDLGTVTVYDLALQDSLVWMATEMGLFYFDRYKNIGGFFGGQLGPAGEITYAVSVYGDEVWFGTDKEISSFNVKTDKVISASARAFKVKDSVHRILASESAVWIAGNNGVFKYDREHERWVHFTEEDGLPSPVVLSLLLDGDYIWFGTDRGLTRFYWNSPYRSD